MDRNTLSHYGWIVVLVLILACLLAFASPFGLFVADGVKAFAAGFVDTNNAALSNEHIQNIQDEWEEQLNDCEHEFTRLANQKTATCQSAGYTGDKVCNSCGKTMETGTVTEKLDHTVVTDNAVPATCEQEGKTEGSHCSVCNTVLVAQTTTDALGHDWGDPYVATEATCLGNGISRIDCQREGCDAHTDTSIKAEGHTIVTVNGKTATCTETGLTNGEKCSVCGTVTSEQQVIPALGHTEVTDSAIQASCEVAGKTEGSHCSVCHVTIKAQETVPALGHSMGTPVTTLTATCTSEGQTKTSCTRTGCGYYEVDSIDALGHTAVTDKAVAATCTATGLTEGKHCSVCNAVITAQTATGALGHEYNSTVTKEATCTENGTITYICIRNDHQYTETTNAIGHTDVNPADNNCDRCGDVIKEVDGLGEVEVDNPDVEITYDPDTGDAGGIVPPSDDEENEPFDIPEEELPETITVNYGTFESSTEYTPGEYATVEYIENVITVKQPVDNNTYNMAWWHIVKDSDGNILSTTAEAPSLSRLPNVYEGTTFSEYIVYSLDDTSTLAMNGVDSNTIWFASIANSEDDTLDNAIYLAAVAQKQHGYDVHIAKWNGTQYVDQGKDTEIDAVSSFTITTPVTKTKEVLISAPTSTTTYTYVPVGTLVAEKGMTWAEWLVSDYNTTGETAPTIKTADFEDVSYDDVIVAGESYGWFIAELAPGLYQTDTNILLYSWQELLDSGVIYLSDVSWYPKGMYVDNEIGWEQFDSLAGDLILPNDGSIETMGFEGFAGGEKVTSVIMPDSIRFIEDGCFGGCTKLKSVVIGANLENIAQYAFSGCTSLTSITFKGTVEQWNAVTFEDGWNNNVPATKVICSDGVVYLSEITFTINGVEYQAGKGMTWSEWVESEYNTLGVALVTLGDETYARVMMSANAISASDSIYTMGLVEVKPDDTITQNGAYGDLGYVD